MGTFLKPDACRQRSSDSRIRFPAHLALAMTIDTVTRPTGGSQPLSNRTFGHRIAKLLRRRARKQPRLVFLAQSTVLRALENPFHRSLVFVQLHIYHEGDEHRTT
ncbi:hypothetical protein [Povalibacter sp.]|uniref:hypothetical protein n=1 Tax=Povalibacter sp. TaxID=1962978 RepID=UPI002F410FBB